MSKRNAPAFDLGYKSTGSNSALSLRKKARPENLYNRRWTGKTKGVKLYKYGKGYYINPRSFTAKVKKIINSQKEKKIYVSSDSGTMTVSDSTPTRPATFQNSPLVITQGTDWNDRIGAQIEIRKVMLNFSLKTNATYANVVQVTVAKLNNNPGTAITDAIWDTLKIATDGSVQGVYTATGVSDSQLPYNSLGWKIHYDEVFQLAPTYVEEGDANLIMRSVDITKMFKKYQKLLTATNANVTDYVYVFFNPLATATGYGTYSAKVVFEYVDS